MTATRAEVLATFGVTEQDLALLEQATGYAKARREADAELAATWRAIQAHTEALTGGPEFEARAAELWKALQVTDA